MALQNTEDRSHRDSVLSSLDMSLGSEDETASDCPEFVVDIANTHASNDELMKRNDVVQFFEKAKGIKSPSDIMDITTREWIGFLPSDMSGKAIPLFTDGAIGYQLHFSYTWMKAVYTNFAVETSNHSKRQDNELMPDFFVHVLAFSTALGLYDVVEPYFIGIPLGKLFLNEAGRSFWTGYEVFVNKDLEISIIYVLDEDGSKKWSPMECNIVESVPLSNTESRNRSMLPAITFAHFRISLSILHSATLDMFRNSIVSKIHDPKSYFLLEIPTMQVLPLLSPSKVLVLFFGRNNYCMNVRSRAGRELLELATEHGKQAIMTLQAKPGYHQSIFPCEEYGLPIVALMAGDEAILQLWLENNKATFEFPNPDQLVNYWGKSAIKLFLKYFEPHISNPSLDMIFHSILRSGSSSTIKLFLDTGRIDVNLPDQNGDRPLHIAIQRHFLAVAKFLLDTDQVDLQLGNSEGQTPLHLAIMRGQRGIIDAILLK